MMSVTCILTTRDAFVHVAVMDGVLYASASGEIRIWYGDGLVPPEDGSDDDTFEAVQLPLKQGERCTSLGAIAVGYVLFLITCNYASHTMMNKLKAVIIHCTWVGQAHTFLAGSSAGRLFVVRLVVSSSGRDGSAAMEVDDADAAEQLDQKQPSSSHVTDVHVTELHKPRGVISGIAHVSVRASKCRAAHMQ